MLRSVADRAQKILGLKIHNDLLVSFKRVEMGERNKASNFKVKNIIKKLINQE